MSLLALLTSNCWLSPDDGPPTVASPKESLKSAIHVCNHHISSSESHYDAARELEDIWRRTIENCQSSSLKRFLWKEGRLSSVHVYEGNLATVSLNFVISCFSVLFNW